MPFIPFWISVLTSDFPKLSLKGQSLAEKYFLCVDGVYIKEGKILLVKRDVEPFRGCWHIIGGHVEENETLKQALKREFKEKTNLDVKSVK